MRSRMLLTAALLWGAMSFGSFVEPVQACPLCKEANETDPNLPRAYMYSIIFMLAMPATVLTGFGVGFYRLSRKGQALAAAEDQALPADEDHAVDDMRREPLPVNVRLLGWASLLNDVASEMVFPILPEFLLTVLGGTRLHLGLIEGFADTVASFLKLWSGGRSDRSGRRKGLVVTGYALAAVARPLIALATVPWHVVAARAGDRVGKGVRTSPRDALIADSTQPAERGRAFGFHRSMDHLGRLGPMLATMFLLWRPDQLKELILITAVPGVLTVLLLAVGLREKPAVATAGPSQRWSFSLRPFDRNFRVYLASLFLFTLGNSTDAFLLVRAGELGVPTPMLPLLWCAFHLVKSSGNVLGGRTVDRWGPRGPLLGGWLIYAAIYFGFAAATTEWQAWTLFLVYAVYYALAEPAEKVLAVTLSGTTGKGLAFGWYNFVIGVAALPASLVFGALYEHFGPGVAFGWGASLALFAAILLLGVRMPRERRVVEPEAD